MLLPLHHIWYGCSLIPKWYHQFRSLYFTILYTYGVNCWCISGVYGKRLAVSETPGTSARGRCCWPAPPRHITTTTTHSTPDHVASKMYPNLSLEIYKSTYVKSDSIWVFTGGLWPAKGHLPGYRYPHMNQFWNPLMPKWTERLLPRAGWPYCWHLIYEMHYDNSVPRKHLFKLFSA